MKFVVLLFLCLAASGSANAQWAMPYWKLGFNPLGLAESQTSLGPAVAYRISERLELWSETSFIFANAYMPRRWTEMKGFRLIIQPRYYLGESGKFFITPEFRLKNFSFDNTLSFVNVNTRDTLDNFSFRENQLLIGGALVVGKVYNLSRKHNLVLEFTAGLGAKHRLIKRRDVPAGYRYYSFKEGRYALGPAYEDHNTGTVLIPFGLRLMWKLK